MTREQPSSPTGPVDGGADGRQPPDDGTKTARLPRWTRQEILVLIQGKKVAENRAKRGRVSGLALGSGQAEPKWASVSSYCKRHGVNRGPVQCRKRWSNLSSDFKKIKEWDSKTRDETESFWLMRNDLRRDRKLPGFFDREVYDILDGGGKEEVVVGNELALALAPASPQGGDGAAEAAEALFDSGRSATAREELFTDFEHVGKEDPTNESPVRGAEHEKQPFSDHPEGRKRKRHASEGEDEATNLEHRLIEAIEKNSKLLSSQIESQNTHLQLDREQRADHMNSLIAVLNKVADALGTIANKS